MNYNRAEEILSSPDNIKVTYKNEPIWIQDLHKASLSASVTVLGSRSSIDVPVKELSEQ